MSPPSLHPLEEEIGDPQAVNPKVSAVHNIALQLLRMKSITTYLRGVCGLLAAIGDAASNLMFHELPGGVVGVVASRFDGLRSQDCCATCLAHIGGIPYFLVGVL